MRHRHRSDGTNGCWLVHLWGPWKHYQVKRPVRVVGPSLRHLTSVIETRRRRRCRWCGEFDDRLVAERADESPATAVNETPAPGAASS